MGSKFSKAMGKVGGMNKSFKKKVEAMHDEFVDELEDEGFDILLKLEKNMVVVKQGIWQYCLSFKGKWSYSIFHGTTKLSTAFFLPEEEGGEVTDEEVLQKSLEYIARRNFRI